MRKIHLLPQHLISKIAAGEVIERPAYAVKELLDNAIDAHADYIRIDISESGLKKIVVTDNGEGMSKEDLQESFKHHTTSKIFEEQDLVAIKSLGFRGEALSSIAAISSLTIQSRPKNQSTGTQITVRNGLLEAISPIGIPIGTCVIVEDIFHSIPARKKFLKSQRTELRHSTDMISNAALAFPTIRFVFSHNDKVIFDVPKTENILNRLSLFLGSSVFQNLLPISFKDSYSNISGFITKPHTSMSTPNKQFIFVNHRRVTDKLISQTIKQAYNTLLDSTSFPIFVLFLSLPYEIVDINIHPRKEQIKFVDTEIVLNAIKNAVNQTLMQNNLIENRSFGTDEKRFFGKKKATESYAALFLKDTVAPWTVLDSTQIHKSTDVIQIHNLYIVAQTKRGLLLVDQHAAHERILFEQFQKAFLEQKKRNDQYELPIPFSIEPSISDAQLLSEHSELLNQLGFELEDFGNNTFKITAIPNLLRDRNPKELLQELLDDLSEEKAIKTVDKRAYRMLTYLACRSAIKAGDVLTKQKCKNLLEELQKTPNKYTCPHGRPTHIEVNLKELHKMFKRT